MNIKELEYFRAVCRLKSITKAAHSLYMTPQGLSKIIKNLENELHVQLFKRSKYGMILNENGKKLVSEIATKNPELKLITSVKKFVDSNSNKDLQIIFDKDVWATDVYSLAFENNSLANLDFKNGVITF